ncbi:putative enzyme [Klebsiella pneumoniae subsp. pneumoniae]|uniref:Putative enzyme n=1 Tax=Klebsiella pneumoniae subsp. pneumoniae TaxID=72407 RepID=A0A378A2U6_KLEPN|nr:putative enzyme [Klebsiella pneumoniae subsp. pneumoniae]
MNVTTLKDTLVARRLALNPWTGFYFLQSLLINLALGYEFSLLYTVAFTCVLHLLWRAFPRVQKAVVGAYSLLAALYYPFGQAYGAPNFNTLLALHATNVEESTEILTIFPWYNYLLAVFIFALGSLRFAVGSLSHHAGEKWIRWACCSASGSSFSSRCKTLPGAVYSR